MIYGRSPKFIWAPCQVICIAVYTHWLRPRNPPSPRIRTRIRGRYWSEKIDDTTSLCNPCTCQNVNKKILSVRHKTFCSRKSNEAQNRKSLCTTFAINFESFPPSYLHEHSLLPVLEPLTLLLSLLLRMLLLLV